MIRTISNELIALAERESSPPPLDIEELAKQNIAKEYATDWQGLADSCVDHNRAVDVLMDLASTEAARIKIESQLLAQTALTDALQARVQELEAEKKYQSERVLLEWSDRGGTWHPTEFWEAVVSCSLDHSYDRVNDGIPYGIPEAFEKWFAPVIEKHLSAITPDWKNKTVTMDEDQHQKFEDDLKEANRAALTSEQE